MCARTESDVIVDAHRERIGFLKHHTNPFAEDIYIHISVNILVVKANVACYLTTLNKVVHSVERL